MRITAVLTAATAAAALTVASLIGATTAHAWSGSYQREVPHGSVALYIISYGGEMPAKQAKQFTASTNKWLRTEGVPADRVTFTVAGYVSRKGNAKTGCSVWRATEQLITSKDARAMSALRQTYDTVIPMIVTANKENCYFAGQALVGAEGVLLTFRDYATTSQRLEIFRHELGHNLGLGHSSTTPLKKKSNLTKEPAQRWNEYGDATSIMGSGGRLTYTDKYALGVVPANAGKVANPDQSVYTLRASGKKDRLLIVPQNNAAALALEYQPRNGVEARAFFYDSRVLWQKGDSGQSLTRGVPVRAGNTTITVTKTTRKSATVRVTYTPDTQAPRIDNAWDWGLTEALNDVTDGWVSITETDGPITADHTTTPTFLNLSGDPIGTVAGLPLLPELTDNTWIATGTLTINDTVVYQANLNPKRLYPAMSTLSKDGVIRPLHHLKNVPVYEGVNTLTITLSDFAGNTTTRHYTFDLEGLPT